MANTTLTFYPVGNGDCNLLEIADGPKMMWDCKFINAAENDDDSKFNVIEDLLDNKLTVKKAGLPFLDAFILTHADKDHCQGFDSKFYLGDPNKISADDKSERKILIGELWYSPRVILEHNDELSEPAKAFKKEALRRINLYKSNRAEANKDGNRIRIIGWAKEDKLEGLEERITVPGTELSEVNGKPYKNFRMFIHAPFKDSIEGEDRNETSIVMQIRIDCDGQIDAGKVVLGGDAEWRVWDRIISLSEDKTLKWDIFEAPHHCSWTFFSDDREEGKPNQASLDFLDKKENGAMIVSSSKFISHMDSNPPCKKAKNRYVEKVGEGNFLCTGGNKNGDAPAPVVFELSRNGFRLKDTKKDVRESNGIVGGKTQPHVYGEIFG